MATLTLSIASQTKSKTISAGDITRVLAALKKQFGQITVSGVTRDMTDAEVFDAWSDNVIQALKTSVVSVETAAAQAALTPIVPPTTT